MKFTKIPSDTFEKLQINAGVILSDFTPATGTFSAAKQIGATTGGITFVVSHSFTDLGDDVDNCPKDTKELKRLDSTEVKISGTYVMVDTAIAKALAAAADIDGTDSTKVVPRTDLMPTDFTDLWFVGDYSDKNGETNGGYIAIHLLNALSTGGFQLKTSDRAKGQFAFEYKAHTSIESLDVVPYELYIKAGTAEG